MTDTVRTYFDAFNRGDVAAMLDVTDEGLPEAKGQRYSLPAGSFLTLRDGRITRITTYYNLADWMRQVSA